MGWYDVVPLDEGNSGLLFGKGKGCEFFNNICYSSDKFEEFCDPSAKFQCSIDRLSKTVCMSKNTYSDGCGIRVPYQSCLVSPPSTGDLEIYRADARCFESNISSQVAVHNYPLRCYTFQTASHDDSQVLVIADRVLCWHAPR